MFKTELAFALNEHPQVVGPRKYRYRSPFDGTHAALRVPEIADDLASINRAIRWGYAHRLGPFEVWDALGVARTAGAMEAAGLAVAGWVQDLLAGGYESFYLREGGEAVRWYYDVGVGGYVRVGG